MARLPRTSPTTRPYRRWFAAGTVAAFATAAVVLMHVGVDPPPPAHAHATLVAQPGTRFANVSTSPDEIVRLDDGTLDIEVTPLHAGERFRVIVGRAEVEVHGTAFQVVASSGRLVAVSVRHGRVEVRPEDAARTLLAGGDVWRATPVRTAEPAPPPVPVVPPPAPPPRRLRTLAPPPPAPAPQRAPEELAYDDAWTAMRAGNFSQAASSFTRVMILAPDGGLAEDAAFWQAVALARGQRRAQAITAFDDFLAAHGSSPHAGEAHAMVGWLLLDSGERALATRHFQAAASDPRKSVRESAQSGLDAAR